MHDEAARSLNRLLPRLRPLFKGSEGAWPAFEGRLRDHFPALFERLLTLYGHRYDFFWHLEQILATAAQGIVDRPSRLRHLDEKTESDPNWFVANREFGAVCYVDLFAGDLAGLRARIPYFRDLGITYLHLMPPFRARPGQNDGGYAVSSYREIAPHLGTMAELATLAAELRAYGIRLCLDFVFNHTADDHDWARRAKAGDPEYQDYYWMFDDRGGPDQYQPHLREIFPDRGADHFTWVPEAGRWVWTTFHRYQWDLNFSNPAVFRQMAEEMLFLANQGVEVLRLDAVPFIWKQAGTPCENLPEAHLVIQAFNALIRVAAPGVMFKSEAIVHPDEVVRYIDPHEARLSYNPLLMVLLWESLATRRTDLLRHSLVKRFNLPAGTGWVNFVRSHDDIGWGFADEDAREIGIDPGGHRHFLNTFYVGHFPGSFARGLPFQDNPHTGDCRICGMTASLAGLEKARERDAAQEREFALRKILLLYGVIATIGGIPMLYLGDEVALTNDYSFRHEPRKADDNRWVHRPATDWTAQRMARASTVSAGGRVFNGIKRLVELRRNHRAFVGQDMEMLMLTNPHVFGYLRRGIGQKLLVLVNVTERDQPVTDQLMVDLLGTGPWTEHMSGVELSWQSGGLLLEPYQFACFNAPV